MPRKYQILILLNIVLTAYGLDISVKGDSCAPADRCSSKGDKACSCEDDCHQYGTCCIDADKFPLMSTSKPLYYCRSKRMEIAAFAKKSCADSFKGHRDHRSICLDEKHDEADVPNHLLVSSTKTHTTYWSKHCGVCNNEDINDLQFWTVTVSCPSKHGDMTFSERFIRKNLSFHEEYEEWGLKIDNDFLLCSLRYTEPDFMAGKVKYCAPFMTSECPDYFADQRILKKCAYYYGERRHKKTYQYYKNVHCAICNGASLKELECSDRNYEPENIFGSSKHSIEVVFSGSWIEKEGAAKYKCSTNFQYDPLQQRCREEIELSTIETVPTSGHNVIVPLYTSLTVALFFLINKYF